MKFNLPYALHERVYLEFKEPSMTEQSHKAECDIETILSKYRLSGVLGDPDRAKLAVFSDVSNVVDYREALDAIMQADEAFDALPAKIRERFDNDPAEFLDFFNDPANGQEMIDLGLAEKPKLGSVSDSVDEEKGTPPNKST